MKNTTPQDIFRWPLAEEFSTHARFTTIAAPMLYRRPDASTSPGQFVRLRQSRRKAHAILSEHFIFLISLIESFSRRHNQHSRRLVRLFLGADKRHRCRPFAMSYKNRIINLMPQYNSCSPLYYLI